MPHHVTEDQFEELVAAVLDEVPEEFWPTLDNLVVIIEDHPPDGEDLLGLYEGVPVTEQSVLDPSAMPDQISIFRISHCDVAEDADDLAGWVRETVFHELGHHLGLSEQRLAELGWD